MADFVKSDVFKFETLMLAFPQWNLINLGIEGHL